LDSFSYTGAPFPPVNITHNVTNFNSDCNVTVVTMWESVGEGIVYMITVLPRNITIVTSDTHVQFNIDFSAQVNYTFSIIAINECNDTSEEVESELYLESMEECSKQAVLIFASVLHVIGLHCTD